VEVDLQHLKDDANLDQFREDDAQTSEICWDPLIELVCFPLQLKFLATISPNLDSTPIGWLSSRNVDLLPDCAFVATRNHHLLEIVVELGESTAVKANY
jgi:hypothetical protein